MTVFTVANRPIQTDWVTTHCCYTTSLINRCSGSSRYFFNGWFATILLQKLTSHIPDTAHRFNHVDRNSNSTALVRDGSCNCLSNPPRGICAELKPTPIFKLVNGTHQASISFLNQVEKRKATIPIFFRYRYNKPQIAFGKPSFRTLIASKNFIYFLHASLQAARCFLACFKNCSVFINKVLPVRCWLFGSFVGIYLDFELSQTTDKSIESWNHGFYALGTQAEFFNQANTAFASAS